MLTFILENCPENFLQLCNLFWTVTSTFFKFGVKALSGVLVTFCEFGIYTDVKDVLITYFESLFDATQHFVHVGVFLS